MNTIDCELAVIGAGMTGMAATLFAAQRGLNVVQIGRPQGFTYASGLFDLMAVHPVEEGKTWQDPFACIETLLKDNPLHPYSLVSKDNIQTAFNELDSFLEAAGIPYHSKKDANSELITAAGTVKTTFKVPKTMWAGVRALENRSPCLLVDFKGLREFSTAQIAAACQNHWPNLRTIQLSFPGISVGREIISGENIARTIARPDNLTSLIQAVRPHIQDAEAVGYPAILGLTDADRVVMELENQLGTAVFEIPSGPPSVPGLRLLEAFSRKLPHYGVRQLSASNVITAIPQSNGNFWLKVENGDNHLQVRSQRIILATGRFLGNGLQTDMNGIREKLFNLPVYQPASRSQWHQVDFFDSHGHPANRAGLEIDHLFRPLDAENRPVFERLHAAGSILAHQDWMRMKCGAGLAIATAFGAVNAVANVAT